MTGEHQDGLNPVSPGFHARNPRDGFLSLDEFTCRMEECTEEQMARLVCSPEFKVWVQEMRYRSPSRLLLRDNRTSVARLLVAFYIITTTTMLFLQTGRGQGVLSTVVSRETAASVILSDLPDLWELQELRQTEERMKELEYLLQMSEVARQHRGTGEQPPSSSPSCGSLQSELRRAREGAAAAQALVDLLRAEKAQLLQQVSEGRYNIRQTSSSETVDEPLPATRLQMLLPLYGLTTGQEALFVTVAATILLVLVKPALQLLAALIQRLPFSGAVAALLTRDSEKLKAAEQAEMLAWQLDRVVTRQDELVQASGAVQIQALQSLKASLGCALGMAAEERADLLKAIHSLEDSMRDTNEATVRANELQATVARLEKEIQKKDTNQAKAADLIDRSQATLERTLSEKQALCRDMDHLRETRDRESALADKLIAKLRSEMGRKDSEARRVSQTRDRALEVLQRAQEELEKVVAENAELTEMVQAKEAEKQQLQKDLKLTSDQLLGPKSHAVLSEPVAVPGTSDELARAWVRLSSAPAFVILSLASMHHGAGAE